MDLNPKPLKTHVQHVAGSDLNQSHLARSRQDCQLSLITGTYLTPTRIHVIRYSRYSSLRRCKYPVL